MNSPSARNPALTFEACLQRLRERLPRDLPGLPAQQRMCPRWKDGKHLPRDFTEPRAAAVLALIHRTRDGEPPCLILTRRSEQIGRHRGQICLPGGVVDSQESEAEAALREFQEETGVALRHEDLLGPLTPLNVPVSGFRVHPFVAATNQIPEWSPSAEEVAELIVVPVPHLSSADHRSIRTERREEGLLEIPFYSFSGTEVWGATAMMLSELEVILFGEESPSA